MSWKKACVFLGDPHSPLLAPRGVYMHGNLLAISDTGQNRVFIWYNFQYTEQQVPDVVLGQLNATDTGRNAGGLVDASSLLYPSGIWTNGEMLIVADAWNHRVLIWHSIPTQHGQPADVVVGQQNFTTAEPNGAGIGASPQADSLYWPYGVWCQNKALWIADTGNRRVLYFKTIPQQNGAKADGVVGQPDMHSRDYDPQHAIWPYSVKTGPHGELLIADTQCFRLMLWQQWQNALQGKSADVLIGQPGFDNNGQNQYGIQPGANTLNWIYDACFTREGIAVADTGNSRLMLWNVLPPNHNATANEVLGQPNFTTNGESSLSMKSKVENEMYWPFALQYAAGYLIAADTGNHRIIFFKDQKPKT